MAHGRRSKQDGRTHETLIQRLTVPPNSQRRPVFFNETHRVNLFRFFSWCFALCSKEEMLQENIEKFFMLKSVPFRTIETASCLKNASCTLLSTSLQWEMEMQFVLPKRKSSATLCEGDMCLTVGMEAVRISVLIQREHLGISMTFHPNHG